MKLRSLFTAAGVGAGVALANRTLARGGGHLEPGVPGQRDTYRWRGMDVSYTVSGDPDGDDLVFLHGTSVTGTSYEFRPLAAELADNYRVIAPDLPGYGRSDRPPLSYSASLYRSFVEEFLDDVAETPTVVASSLSAGYAAGAASDVDVDDLVLICPTTGSMGPSVRRRELLRSPVIGTALFNAITSKPAIRHFSADHGFYDPAALPDERVDYLWRTTHQPGARFAPASFLGGQLNLDDDLESTIGELDVPVTLLWGREASATPLRQGRELAAATDARLLVVDYAQLLPHVEHPETVAQALRDELPRASE